MAAGGGTKAIVAAFFASSGIAVSKFVGFFFTRSSSMLAEAVHSVTDAGKLRLRVRAEVPMARPMYIEPDIVAAPAE